ncbi:MAG: hypothetical protein JWM11_246 [Planctomycetaceae bacterium]|nr:hypothetical protein [Planctomycetaceae bacterium]
MSRRTLKKLAILGALSLGGMTQPAMAQFGLFGGGFGGGCCNAPPIPPTICGPSCAQPVAYQVSACAPPPIACAPPVPQYVMQPFTETRVVEQVVQRPVCQTKMVEVPQTEYRPVVENQTAMVPSIAYQNVPQTEYRPVVEQQIRQEPAMTYQNVTEMQCRQRDAGQWVTQYRCRPTVAPCAYDNRPGLLGALNRSFYTARMAVTPAIIAERSYVPNVITEQIPVTRQVAVPTTRQVAYNVTKMVPYTTMRQVAVPTTKQVAYQVTKYVPYTTTRQVAVQEVRMVAETIKQPVTTTTFRMVPTNSATVLGGDPYSRNAMGIGPYPQNALAQPDPRFASPAPPAPLNRTANALDALDGAPNSPTVTPATPPAPPTPINKRTVRPNSLNENDDPNPGVPRSSQFTPSSDSASEEDELVELAETAPPTIRQATGGFQGVAPRIETVSSTPSIVRISRSSKTPTAPALDMSVAASDVKGHK